MRTSDNTSTPQSRPLMLFAPESGRMFAEKVASALGTQLSHHEEREFEDGEHKSRPLASVRGADVYVLQSLYSEPQQSVNDKLCRLLFFLGSLRDAGASRLTAITPYLCYARKDRKTKPRDPVTSRYVARLFEAVGVDHVVTLDVHNLAAYQNAFRCQTDHLEAVNVFVRHFAETRKDETPVILSPDAGGTKRADRFREALSKTLDTDLASAFMEKKRSWGKVTGDAIVGEVEGSTVIIMDDLIASGKTLTRAARACRQQGARRVLAAATHGAFVFDANEALADENLESVVITDTIPPLRIESKAVKDKLTVLETAPMMADAIRRLHEGGSLVELNEP